MTNKSQCTGGQVAVTGGKGLKDIKTMTDRELDAEIAKGLGWADVHFALEDSMPADWVGQPPVKGGHGWWESIPRFSTDLNAVHEVEMEAGLSYMQEIDYYSKLQEFALEGLPPCNEPSYWREYAITCRLLQVSARQRAEALLLCLRSE